MRAPPRLGLWTIKCPQQLWWAPPDTQDYPHQSIWSDFAPCVGVLQSSYKYEQHLTESSCCYCHTAKFGPSVQSLRLRLNQLNQQSLIPVCLDKFIKGLISVISCFTQPNHFPRSRVTQNQGYEIFPHTPDSIRWYHMPKSGLHCN